MPLSRATLAGASATAAAAAVVFFRREQTRRATERFAAAALETLLNDQDAAYVDDPCTVVRTVFVPADAVSAVDFGITPAQTDALFDAGTAAAQAFLSTWDFDAYVGRCRA